MPQAFCIYAKINTEDDRRTERIKMHNGGRPITYRYSTEAEITNQDIYDLKKKHFGLHGLYKNLSALKGLNP